MSEFDRQANITVGKIATNTFRVFGTMLLLTGCSFPKGVDHPSALNPDGSLRVTSTAPRSTEMPTLSGSGTPQPPTTFSEEGSFITDPNTGNKFPMVVDPTVPEGAPGNYCAEIGAYGQSFISLEDALQAVSGRNKFRAWIYNYPEMIFDRDKGEQIPPGTIYWAGGAFACAVP